MIAASGLIIVSLFHWAVLLWGTLTLPARVSFSSFGPCDEVVAWTFFKEREIVINKGCGFSPGFLQAILIHEYGHLLCLCSDHNESDPSSIMNPVVYEENQITEEDKWRAQ